MDWLRRIQGQATLAPMAGASDFVFRLLCREMGCPMATTEMVSAKGYLMAGDRPAVQELLIRSPGETLALQLFGHHPGEMAEAARRLEEGGYCAIDINMGCPAPKITGNGDGSALMEDPQAAAAIVRAVKGAVSLPVTVKMRIGWDASSRNHVDFALRMQDAGADALTVHGRTREQHYAGVADWDAIAQVVKAVAIPVIGNGDVADAASFHRMLTHTGCHAAAIGRAALGNPWVFQEVGGRNETRASGGPLSVESGAKTLGNAQNGHSMWGCKGRSPLPEREAEPRSVPLPSPTERAAMCLRHAAMLCAWKGERAAIREMRTHAAYYLKGIRDAAAIRRQAQRAETLEQLREVLDAWGAAPNPARGIMPLDPS